MADFRDHLYQRVSKRVNRSFWQFWVKIWDLVLPGDPQPCGLENGDIDLRFPWIFHFLVHRWGHKRRAGDFVWNSSEKDDLKFRHLFMSVETSWNILEDLCLPRVFSRLSYFHSPRRRKHPVLVGSGRGTLECCHMLPWGDQMKHEIDINWWKFSCWSLV